MTTFQGQLYWRGDDGYEQARVGRVFNARQPDRYPAVILIAQHEMDVVAAIQLARQRGLKIAVRSGGHSWAAWSVQDDALLVDLAGLHEIDLDKNMSLVRVSPSVSGGELNEFLDTHGLMFHAGHCPTVGLGGFLLQGGMGWNCRGWGWACESIEAIDVVTAAGDLVRANNVNHADLLWAARGAGPGFFGIVTRFHLKTRPLPAALTQSTFIYAMNDFDQVMHWLHDIHPTLAPSVEVVAVGATLPLSSEVKHTGGPVLAVHGLAFAETHEEAVSALAPFETCPVVDKALVQEVACPTSLALECLEQLRANPAGHRYAVDNVWTNAGADSVVPALRNAFTTLPTEKSFSLWFGMAPRRPLPDMALSLQADLYVASYVIWEHEDDDERCQTWLASQMHRMEPIAEGLFLADSDLATRPAKFLSDSHWQRLETLRAQYDPTGLFFSYLARPETQLNVNPWTDLSSLPFALKADHCGLSVPDLEASIVWYHDILGFSLEQRFGLEEVPFNAAFLKRGEFRIELFEVVGASPLPRTRRHPNEDLFTHGTKHIAFAVQDVRAVFDELKRRGVDIAMDVFVVEGIGPGGFIRDNAGNLIELIER